MIPFISFRFDKEPFSRSARNGGTFVSSAGLCIQTEPRAWCFSLCRLTCTPFQQLLCVSSHLGDLMKQLSVLPCSLARARDLSFSLSFALSSSARISSRGRRYAAVSSSLCSRHKVTLFIWVNRAGMLSGGVWRERKTRWWYALFLAFQLSK